MKPSPPDPSSDDGSTGVPGFRSWSRVYAFVFAVFVVIVVLLALFSRIFA